MIANVICTHRLKGSRPDMQRHKGLFNALCLTCREKVLGKMQTRRRRGYRTIAFSVHRLVALLILGVVRTVDIRRQRHVAIGIELL